MKQIISIFIALSVILTVFSVPAMAAGESVTVQAQKYAVASETPIKSGRKIIVNSGVTVMYNAEIPAEGLYKVALYCTGEDAVLDYSVNNQSGSYDFSQFGDSATYLGRTLGRYNLAAGTVSVKITPAIGSVTITKLVFTRLVTDISAEGLTTVEAEEYTGVNFNEKAYVDNQSEYNLAYDALSNTGCVAFTGNNQTAAYNLNAETSGFYKITMYATGLLERNKLTLKDGDGDVLSTAEYVNENVCVFNNVPLGAGKNEIILDTGRTLYITGTDYNFIYAYCFGVQKLDRSVAFAKKSGETDFSASFYLESKGTVVSDAQGNVTLGAASSVTYEIYAPKSDTYKLLAKGRASGSADITVVCDKKTETRRFESASKKNTLGRFDLAKGINTVTITASAETVINTLYIKAVSYDIGEDTVYISAIDYTETNLNEAAVVDNQIDYTYTMDEISGKGTAVFSTLNLFMRYKVNVQKGGLYNFTVNAGNVQEDMKYSLTSITSGRGVTGVKVDANRIGFDKIQLNAGENILELKSTSGNYYPDGKVNYVYFYCIKSEFAWDSHQAKSISTTSENIIPARECTDFLGDLQKDEKGVSLDGGDRLIYSLDCPAEQTFELKIHGDADTKIRINGINVFEAPVEDEAIAVVTLKDGENVLSADGNGVFESFVLRPVEQKYIDLFDISDAGSAKDVERILDGAGLTVKELFYPKPVYERLLNGKEKFGNGLLQAFYSAVYEEKQNPKARLFKDGAEIYALEDGNLKMTLLDMDKTAIAAIYDGDRMIKARLADNEMLFENVTGENKSFKIIYLEDLQSFVPTHVFTEVYAEIFVSPKGSDTEGDGSEEKPYATIKKAKETARTLSEKQWGDIVVNILPGLYRIEETEQFTVEDSGKNGFGIIYRGTDKNNPPQISGGKKVTGWEQTDGVIWSAPLENIEHVRNLYINSYPAARARSKYQYELKDYYKADSTSGAYDGIKVSAVNFLKSFEKPEDMELVFNTAWENHRIPVEGISYVGDEAIFTLKADVLNAIANRGVDKIKGGPFYIENAKELLDEPGEFYYSKDEERIYYYPYSTENLTDAEVFVGETQLLVNISGESPQNKVENLTFENLIFRYGAYDFVSDYGYIGTQSDGLDGSMITAEDGRTAFAPQFDVKMADNIQIKDCEFSCLGSAVIGMTDGVTNSQIIGNLIRDVSGTAVAIGRPLHHDYSEERQVCENIRVSNNVIRRSGNELFNNAAISVYYERNIEISNNTLLDLPYTGITAGWGWEGSDPFDCGNINISNNHIENVLEVLSDGGQIYTLGKLENSQINGNFLKKNNVHYWSGGIYLDAGSAYLDVFDNVIEESYPWIEVQEPKYNTHDLNIYSNYSDTQARDRDEGDTVFIEEPESNDSAEATLIKANAGVTEDYKYLVSLSQLPDGKGRRTDFVPRLYFRYSKPQSRGKIQAEDFMEGGEGVGYHKGYRPKPNNNPYRSDSVSLIKLGGAENFVIDTNSGGDWYQYEVNLPSDGYYYIDVCGRILGTTKVARMYANDSRVGDISITNQSDFATGTTGPVWLKKGLNRIKLYQLTSFYIDYIEVHKKGESDTTDYSPKEDAAYDEGVLVQN